jgi:hypothetical protein
MVQMGTVELNLIGFFSVGSLSPKDHIINQGYAIRRNAQYRSLKWLRTEPKRRHSNSLMHPPRELGNQSERSYKIVTKNQYLRKRNQN